MWVAPRTEPSTEKSIAPQRPPPPTPSSQCDLIFVRPTSSNFRCTLAATSLRLLYTSNMSDHPPDLRSRAHVLIQNDPSSISDTSYYKSASARSLCQLLYIPQSPAGSSLVFANETATKSDVDKETWMETGIREQLATMLVGIVLLIMIISKYHGANGM